MYYKYSAETDVKYNIHKVRLTEVAHMESIHIPLLSFSTKPIFQIIIGFAGLKFNFLLNLVFMLLEIGKFHGEFEAYWLSGKLKKGWE